MKLELINTTNKYGVVFYNFELHDELTNKNWKFEARYSEINNFYKKIKN